MNKHKLPREIPRKTKEIIRRNSYFGCVVCGGYIVDYEHVDPEFKDATEHDPNCMTLLCQNHHRQVTNGIMAKSTVKKYMQDPFGKKNGHASNSITFGTQDKQWQCVIGETTIASCQIILEVAGTPMLYITPDLDGIGWALNALFLDLNGKELLRIEGNEWKVDVKEDIDNWDILTVKDRLEINHKEMGTVLKLQVDSNNSRFIIDALKMNHKGRVFIVHKGVFSIINTFNGMASVVQMQGGIIASGKVAFSL